jgi:uncharacterized protein HemX
MKSQHTFWTAILLLVALTIGGCLEEAVQEQGLTTKQSNQLLQEQDAQR